VIPDVTVRVRPVPQVRRYEAWIAESFEDGTEIVRALAQDGTLPDIIRVSDEEETRVSLALSGPKGAQRALFEGYLGLRGKRGGALVIAGFEGTGESLARRRALAVRQLRSAGAAYIGQEAGRGWERNRYHGPYLRDTLLDMGAMAETLETSHTWTGLRGLYEAVGEAIRSALRGQSTPGLVYCHLSHAYADGASLYFTFVSRARLEDPIAQWRAVKTAACDAIVAAGGTITHHHAVGRDHRPYYDRQRPEPFARALRAAKAELDPRALLNPGVLFDAR
jgi:alkyldihydroxyacetonephosphate synthase